MPLALTSYVMTEQDNQGRASTYVIKDSECVHHVKKSQSIMKQFAGTTPPHSLWGNMKETRWLTFKEPDLAGDTSGLRPAGCHTHWALHTWKYTEPSNAVLSCWRRTRRRRRRKISRSSVQGKRSHSNSQCLIKSMCLINTSLHHCGPCGFAYSVWWTADLDNALNCLSIWIYPPICTLQQLQFKLQDRNLELKTWQQRPKRHILNMK